MKAPLKRAVTIYFSGERFSIQHPERLQCCILDAKGKKYYFYDCSSKLWHWGKFRKLLNVSSDNPHVSPHTCVRLHHVLCAFLSAPVSSRDTAPVFQQWGGQAGGAGVEVHLFIPLGRAGAQFSFSVSASQPPGGVLNAVFPAPSLECSSSGFIIGLVLT